MTAITDALKPKKSPAPHRKGKCAWCGNPFETRHPTKTFCTPAHSDAFGNYAASRGKVLFPIALAWRTARGRKGTGADAMAEMVRFLDQCAAELAAQGAPPIAKHFAATRASGSGATQWADYPRHRPSRVRPEQSPPASG